MNYDDALDIAKENIEKFPQFERNGRVFVRIGDKEFPKDWLVKNAALMKTRGEI